MRSWGEFVAGEGYPVEQASTTETISVWLVEDEHEVRVRGTGAGTLFDRVFGCCVHALAANSDHLMVHRQA